MRCVHVNQLMAVSRRGEWVPRVGGYSIYRSADPAGLAGSQRVRRIPHRNQEPCSVAEGPRERAREGTRELRRPWTADELSIKERRVNTPTAFHRVTDHVNDDSDKTRRAAVLVGHGKAVDEEVVSSSSTAQPDGDSIRFRF